MLMMLPFEAPTIFEGIHRTYFRMPRVVKDQRTKFENDEIFRHLSHEGPVKYTGYKDRPLEERQMRFLANCQEGHTEVSFVQSGYQFTLMFNSDGCDCNKELGKVHIKANFILNGVCVLWRGWIDLQRLEGFGCLEFDAYHAYIEEAGSAANAMQPNPNALNPTCMGPLPPPPPQANQLPHQHLAGLAGPPPPPAPVSLANSAAHYNIAVAAAAAAAAASAPFHQVPLTAPPPPPPPAAVSQANLTGGGLAAPMHNGNGNHQYSNNNHARQHQQPRNDSRSPPDSINVDSSSIMRERHAIKRAAAEADEQNSHLPDHQVVVDVVSDINAHELDFPPRRIFKTQQQSSITTVHHRATRRA